MSVKHNQRCAIFHDPPGLRDASACDCGAIPPLEKGPIVYVIRKDWAMANPERFAEKYEEADAVMLVEDYYTKPETVKVSWPEVQLRFVGW